MEFVTKDNIVRERITIRIHRAAVISIAVKYLQQLVSLGGNWPRTRLLNRNMMLP